MGRFVIAAGIAALCGWLAPGVALADPFDIFRTRWRWAENVDPITDATVSHALCRDRGYRRNDPWLGGSPRFVDLRRGPSLDHNRLVVQGRGQQKPDTRVSLEGRPGRQLSARYVNRYRQQSSDIESIRQFLADAGTSTRLYVRVNSDLSGPQSATFAAGAGADMAARFGAACPSVGE
jgi:hypothetical protein